jgi:hypothetical protein
MAAHVRRIVGIAALLAGLLATGAAAGAPPAAPAAPARQFPPEPPRSLDAEVGRRVPNRAVLFDDAGYMGRPLIVTGANADLSSVGFSRQASSIRFSAGERWQVCSLPDYRGRCRVLAASSPDLGTHLMNDLISSLRRLP